MEKKLSAAEIKRDIAEVLVAEPRRPSIAELSRPREELVLAANSAAAMVFVGKPRLTDSLMAKARRAAFEAIRRYDPLAGTADHPHAAYAHGIGALAEEGVTAAVRGWQKIREGGGAPGIKRRHDLGHAVVGLDGSGRFRVQIFDAGSPAISSRTDDYRAALRRASDELLGSGGDYAEIFLGSDKVAKAYLQRKNRKYSVKIVGEKPRR